MTFSSDKLLDGVGWKLLALLQEDARRSYSELGRAVGLSAPAVAERVRRLEEAGVITGYHAAVNPQRVGLAILALIRLSGVADQAPLVSAAIAGTSEVLECHRVTGSDSYVLKVVAASIPHLEALIDRLLPFGEVTTSLVLSTPVARRVIRQPNPKG
jgi:Lrp/AsnC family leucine-responsive transcriptional regulator